MKKILILLLLIIILPQLSISKNCGCNSIGYGYSWEVPDGTKCSEASEGKAFRYLSIGKITYFEHVDIAEAIYVCY